MVGEYGIAPSEYWQMTPAEVHLLLDSKRPKHIGGIHEDDLDMMMIKRQEMLSRGEKCL